MCSKYNGILNKIFEYYWNQHKQLSAISSVTNAPFGFVYEQIWNPTISLCQSMLSQLKDKTITLEEVEILYQIENFSSHLWALCNAMHHCYPSSKESIPVPIIWIPQTVAHITLYHEIANNPKCSQAACVILKVKRSLQLGNFKIIEDLAKHVCMYGCNYIARHDIMITVHM